jgi:hypothetical protein
VTGEIGERDRRVVLDRAPRFAILDEPQSLDYRVIDPNLAPGSAVHDAAPDRWDRGRDRSGDRRREP